MKQTILQGRFLEAEFDSLRNNTYHALKQGWSEIPRPRSTGLNHDFVNSTLAQINEPLMVLPHVRQGAAGLR
ncbi:MAG: hypothetical protein AAF383_04795 [Cyanobacteria bacterium P01_A01_bin.83]